MGRNIRDYLCDELKIKSMKWCRWRVRIDDGGAWTQACSWNTALQLLYVVCTVEKLNVRSTKIVVKFVLY
jgi:hypothetical protein